MNINDAIELGRRLGKAETALEEAKTGHADRCIVEMDPESYAPCNCGASSTNAAIDKAIRILKGK
jgi:hypothetical protein